MDSHIQIPAFLLREFTLPNMPFLWAFDYCKQHKYRVSPKSFNTKEDYYSQNFEHFLSDYSENPLGNVIKKICNIVENGDFDNWFSNKELQALKDFPFMLFSRDEQQVQKIIRLLKINPNLPEFEKHEIGVCFLMNLLQSDDIYKNCKNTIIINNTDRPFVTNSIGSGIVKNSRGMHIYTPLTPKYALYTYCGQSNFLFLNQRAVFITNEETINIINSTIVQSAMIRQAKILLLGYGRIDFPFGYIYQLEQKKSDSYGGQPCLLTIL